MKASACDVCCILCD